MSKIPGQIYRVGGCVRDALLDIPSQDIDYVVVGASPQAMLDAGFTQVGADFPVFLHPQTHDEYALARTERKTGPGYNGFAVYASADVTLEEDLSRRDFTINAMAMDESGKVFDPYTGQKDLKDGVLRHVSDAFADDPLRVIRGARFAARYCFDVAPETQTLMQHLVDTNTMKELVKERVRVEFEKAFKCANASRMFDVLRDLKALPDLLPLGFDQVEVSQVVEKMQTSRTDWPAHIWWGALLYTALPTESQESYRQFVQQYKLPKESEHVAAVLQRRDLAPVSLDIHSIEQVWSQCDARRQGPLFNDIMACWDSLHNATQSASWVQWDKACRNINEAEIAQKVRATIAITASSGLSGVPFKQEMTKSLSEARVDQLKAVLVQPEHPSFEL